jgi:hypothetical protein
LGRPDIAIFAGERKAAPKASSSLSRFSSAGQRKPAWICFLEQGFYGKFAGRFFEILPESGGGVAHKKERGAFGAGLK